MAFAMRAASGKLAMSRATPCTRPAMPLRTPAPRPAVQRQQKQQQQQRADVRVAAMAGGTGMSPELKRSVDEFIAANKVVVFMKGNKEAPQCGFSARVVQVLSAMEVPFESVNILEDERLRSGMKEYSQWPTFPQVYINGEFYGGADIVMETAVNGQLKEALEVAMLE